MSFSYSYSFPSVMEVTNSVALCYGDEMETTT